MSFTIEPKNKHLVIEPMESDKKLGEGLIFAAPNATNQYGFARVIAVDECPEAKGISPGDTVLYDKLGEVSHRVGNRSIVTVKVLNVLGVVRPEVKVVTKFEEIKRVIGRDALGTNDLDAEFAPSGAV